VVTHDARAGSVAGVRRVARVDGRIWTVEELEALSPREQDELFRASIVRDLAEVPPELRPLLEWVRAEVEARIEGRDLPGAS